MNNTSQVSLVNGSIHGSISDIQQFVHVDQETLDGLYRQGQAERIPHGVTEGRAMFFPGTLLNAFIAAFARIFWQGKVFDAEKRMLINRVMGFRAVKARLYIGESLFDGKPSVIIDYEGTSWIFGFVRDEIREVSPGFWLGRAYAKLPSGKRVNAVNFGLKL